MLARFFPARPVFAPYWWVARRVVDGLSPLLLHAKPVGTLEGSDSLAAWLLDLWNVIFALVAALIWSFTSKATEHRRLLDLNRTFVRYSLSCALLGYGLAKVFCRQFWQPSPVDLLQTFAGSTPFALMWRFTGYSPAYQVFGGVLETVGALLLLWRRTTTLGAAVLAGVLLNVVVLNFTYQIPVKNFSSEFLLQALWLLLPQLARLGAVLLEHEPAKAPPLRPFPPPRRFERARVAVKAVCVVALVAAITVDNSRIAERRRRHPSLWGAYDVEALTFDGADAAGPRAWARVAFGSNWGPVAAIVTADGTYRLFSAKHDEAERTMELGEWTEDDEEPKPQTLHVEALDATHLELHGRFDAASVRARLRLHDLSDAPIYRRFTWVDDGGDFR